MNDNNANDFAENLLSDDDHTFPTTEQGGADYFSLASGLRGNSKGYYYNYKMRGSKERKERIIAGVIMGLLLSVLVIGGLVGGSFALYKIIKRFTSSRIVVDERPIVILVGISAFRHDFLELYNCPNLNQLAKRGVRAERLIPSFPSTSIPNDLTIVTGLYPESHGILDSHMYDYKVRKYFDVSKNYREPYWFNSGGTSGTMSAEPIWVTATKNNITTASVSWIGSNVPIGGHLPKYFDTTYDRYSPITDRINKLFSYLDNRKDRAQFISLQLPNIDDNAHKYGIESVEVSEAIAEIDEAVGYIIDGIQQRSKTLPNIHLLVVSDHGLAPVVATIRLDLISPYINNANYTRLKTMPSNYPMANVFNDVYDMYNATDSNQRVSVNTLYNTLNAHASEQGFVAYKKEDIPDEYNYKNHHRIPPILLMSELRFSFAISSKTPDKASHGYDPQHLYMGGLFIGSGRSFKSDGATVPAFENIHLYSLMAHILKIEPAPNNGSIDAVSSVLKHL